MADEEDDSGGSSWLDSFTQVASTAGDLAAKYAAIRQRQQQQLFPNYGGVPKAAAAPMQGPQQPHKSLLQMILDFFTGRRS